jgi:hypothetical protein
VDGSQPPLLTATGDGGVGGAYRRMFLINRVDK